MRPLALHTIAGLKDRAGGVSRSVPGLCEALAREGCGTVLVTQAPVGTPTDELLLPDPRLVDTRLLRGYDWESLRFSYTPRLRSRLAAICEETRPTVLHDHGVWLHMNHAAAAAARRRNLKRVVSPRGMLDQWAMSFRGWRKSVAWRAYQRDDLLSATAFCTTSRMEADGVRRLGFEQPIAIIPNGIELPEVAVAERPHSGPRSVVFMSRLHPKKGLLDLVAAWQGARVPGWRLVIAGPDEGGYRRVVADAIAAAGAGETITLVGTVAGSDKDELLRRADLFVLPSYSENFGIVVGEALAYGVPVITTTATPWQELATGDCGWWIEPGAAALEQALKNATQLPDERRAQMGRRGRKLIESRYSWHSVARNHIALYEWLAGTAPPPDTLHS